MDKIEISEWTLMALLGLTFLICAFTSASETGLMSINRYKLKHSAKTDPKAKRIANLLAHPERLLGAILILDTFSTAAGSSLLNEIAVRWWGEMGIFLSPIILTLFLLVFANITPKSLAALKPESTARFVARPLQVLQYLLYPLAWAASGLSSLLLRLVGIKMSDKPLDALSSEELRTVVNEASGLIPSRHQAMLLSILDLEKIRVEHIMIPRNEVVGIDLDKGLEDILQTLKKTEHTLLPVYHTDLDNVKGILHTRNAVKVLAQNDLSEKNILNTVEEPYFIPEGASLHTQLLNFQHNKKRMALVVDEYGDVLGLVTLEDILEEIVGDFTTVTPSTQRSVVMQEDGSFIVDGGVNLRELNRSQQLELPSEGPTTLNGLIMETLEAIPEPGTALVIAGYPIEVIQMKDNMVKSAKISPRLAIETDTEL